MIQVSVDNSFEEWRGTARVLLRLNIPPDDVIWTEIGQNKLFDRESKENVLPGESRVPVGFIDLAGSAACFDDPSRWSVLYRVLYRLVNESRHLLQIESDPDVRQLNLMATAVRRDIHKFHAFVRFRRIEWDDKEIFVAWHEPHHFTVEPAAPFFARRFGSMHFSILTPKGCAHWDQKQLVFSDPVDRSLAPAADEVEDLWLLYYGSIFNPFRLNVDTMKRELPVRHWSTLQEAALIPELIRKAAERPDGACVFAESGQRENKAL